MARTAASETEIGKLHLKVVKVLGMSLDQMIKKLEEGDLAEFAVDTKLLAVVTKFLNDNKIWSVPEEDNEESDFAKKIRQIKESQNVVPFREQA